MKAFKTPEEIETLFIEEYKKKYKPLQQGKTTLKQLKEQSLKDVKKSSSIK